MEIAPVGRFADVVYWLDDSINVQERLELKTLLDAEGARPAKQIESSAAEQDVTEDPDVTIDSEVLPIPAARFDIPECTHIITLSWNLIERGIIQRDPDQAERLGNSLWIVKVSTRCEEDNDSCPFWLHPTLVRFIFLLVSLARLGQAQRRCGITIASHLSRACQRVRTRD